MLTKTQAEVSSLIATILNRTDLTDDDRIEIFYQITRVFCTCCGRKSDEEMLKSGIKCQCWNDE